jgi:hypothetical protein
VGNTVGAGITGGGRDCVSARPDALELGFSAEAHVSIRRTIKLVREGRYVADVEVELIESEEAWSPYLSLEDARKLDQVRQALQREDLDVASRLAAVYVLTPV